MKSSLPSSVRTLFFLPRVIVLFLWMQGGFALGAAPIGPLERVTTAVPFPRGLVEREGMVYMLARGRAREVGSVAKDVDDMAGTIFQVDPAVFEPGTNTVVSAGVAANARVFAAPTDPPFRLFDRKLANPTEDDRTDRPYCVLRFHEPTLSFYLCAFSGIDLAADAPKDKPSFKKNFTDAVFRYDLRTEKWYEVERHDPAAGATYPSGTKAPTGLLKGPDNCLTIGNWLYVAAKDNSLLAAYDLSRLVNDPEAGPPEGRVVLGDKITMADGSEMSLLGHSALAERDGWLYVGCRTSSVVIRLRLGKDGLPQQPIRAELLAKFQPWEPETRKTADLTDIGFDLKGRLYILCAKPASVWRLDPESGTVLDALAPGAKPLVSMAELTGQTKIKGENILLDSQDRLYVSTGDGYDASRGTHGTVYRVSVLD